MKQPLAFHPAMETPEPDEAETTAELVRVMTAIQERTLADGGHALRSVHAKGLALLKGELRIPEGLPPTLAQGLFARPGAHAVVMRFSTIPGDLLDDAVSVPRGLALKVFDVEGERLPGSEGDATQDFVLVNGPAFGAPDVKAFLKTLKLVAATTDRAPGLKRAASTVLRGLEHMVEAFGGESATLKTLGGHPWTHPLGDTFYSQAPILYGAYVAKISLAPTNPALRALKGAPVDLAGRPDGLREAMRAFFQAGEARWDLRAQLCVDPDAMPIEDSSVVWPEEESPFVTVGEVIAGPQAAWSEALAREIDDGMAFSPWHGLAAHRPLGSIMRTRKPAYEASARFRGERNACPMHR